MKIGDILSIRIPKPPYQVDAKLVLIQPGDSQGKTEMFNFEFIAGPDDGNEIRMTRRQLDANQQMDYGGDEWKEPRQ